MASSLRLGIVLSAMLVAAFSDPLSPVAAADGVERAVPMWPGPNHNFGRYARDRLWTHERDTYTCSSREGATSAATPGRSRAKKECIRMTNTI